VVSIFLMIGPTLSPGLANTHHWRHVCACSMHIVPQLALLAPDKYAMVMSKFEQKRFGGRKVPVDRVTSTAPIGRLAGKVRSHWLESAGARPHTHSQIHRAHARTHTLILLLRACTMSRASV
jgi:hypothetical protein